VWPGRPVTAHWGVADPATLEGDIAKQAFREAFRTLEARIRLLVCLPIAKIAGLKLKQRLEEIGRT
jgi:arsenate reductase